MRIGIAAAVTALVLGVAPASVALAYNSQWTGYPPYESEAIGALPALGVHDGPFYDRCPMSSAAEGNANQQTRPVKQYGQTAGGRLC